MMKRKDKMLSVPENLPKAHESLTFVKIEDNPHIKHESPRLKSVMFNEQLMAER